MLMMTWRYQDLANNWMDRAMMNKPRTKMFDEAWEEHECEQLGGVLISNILGKMT